MKIPKIKLNSVSNINLSFHKMKALGSALP